jgi:hypothetical protein
VALLHSPVTAPQFVVGDAGEKDPDGAFFGEHLTGHTPSTGFALGIAWTPPSFFPPSR